MAALVQAAKAVRLDVKVETSDEWHYSSLVVGPWLFKTFVGDTD